MNIKHGRFTLRILKESSFAALDVVIKNNLTYEKIKYLPNGDINLLVHSSLKDQYINVFSQNEIESEDDDITLEQLKNNQKTDEKMDLKTKRILQI